ncbi:transcription factor TFIIIB component [Aspergillus costaricaensis CBS 115574]|uniref:Transcription factor TFIIIB component n=1 Tax=Aspergillus costaricaensis CBS 115574 TaxID=1448317 RepID=A0ACD1IWH6_9EURO|nr:transcription factor TFIIIB component [Aspergillus costaricaensis CBS 115574]RAK94710.1 transcription factor TFIIIB component [Aspergillus costaricaensis CBS 115574]
MKSFSSSAINKSGKKFAPKAPARRPPASAPPRRPSVASQPSASQTPQPPTETATPEPGPPAFAVQASVPTAPSIPEEPAVSPKENVVVPQSATAIPIPRPKRKASVSAVSPGTIEQISTPPQPTPPTPTAPEPQVEQTQATVCDTAAAVPETQISRPDNDATVIRPSKRPKTTGESIAITTDAVSTVSAPSAAAAAAPPHPATTTRTTESIAIDANPQLVTPPATQAALTDSEGTTDARPRTDSQVTVAEQGRKPTRTRRKSVKDVNGENATKKKERKPRTRKKREPTPEGAESVEIAPAMVKMSELCKDLRTGKMSKRETELRNMEQAEQERKQKAQQEGDTEAPVKENVNDASPAGDQDENPDNKAQAGPVMRIVNGEIVLDTASLQVDRHADAARNAGDLEDVIENSFTRKINQATYGKRSKTESWDEEMTDLFYRGLRMFGTDFMMISKLFPGRSRRQIKLKFNNEERRDPQRIKETLLGPRETIDISTYSEMTNTVYDDPRLIQQELDEERKRIEAQHAKEKEAQEEMLRNPDGAAGGADGTPANDMPVKAKRNNRKQAMKAMAGGTEEVLGTIDDIP